MRKKEFNKLYKKLIRRVRLIRIGRIEKNEKCSLVAVGRIQNGIMEIKMGYGKSLKSKNSVFYMSLTHPGG